MCMWTHTVSSQLVGSPVLHLQLIKSLCIHTVCRKSCSFRQIDSFKCDVYQLTEEIYTEFHQQWELSQYQVSDEGGEDDDLELKIEINQSIPQLSNGF